MNEHICFKHLKLEMPPLNDLSLLATLPDKGHVPISTRNINRDLIEFMYSRDVRIKNADVFCSPPGFELGIHVDGIKLSNNVATNWAYCEKQGALMQWWKPKSDEQKVFDPSKESNAYKISTTPYALAWSEEEVDFLTEVEVGTPTLVNIGVPHGMKNRTDVHRKAISITWLYNNGDLQWEDAVEIFKDIIVE